MAGDEEQRLADEELHDEVGALRRFELDGAALVDRLPKELGRGHDIGEGLRTLRLCPGKQSLVAIDDGGLDDRAAFDQMLEQHACLVDLAQALDAHAPPHRLADRPRRLIGGLRRPDDEVGEI